MHISTLPLASTHSNSAANHPPLRFPNPESRLLRFPNPDSRFPPSAPHRQHRDLLTIVIQLLGTHDQRFFGLLFEQVQA
ncbi:hypothetical protein CPBF367_08800 [Xanthomonas arboricola pv. juglandis]|nr:hypothetical protein CPBF367_08800 [Xanthomonas arboricola pv. juglandis]